MLYVAVLYSFDSHPKSHSISEKPFSLNLLFYRLENGPIKTISRKIHNSQNYLLESKGEETINLIDDLMLDCWLKLKPQVTLAFGLEMTQRNCHF